LVDIVNYLIKCSVTIQNRTMPIIAFLLDKGNIILEEPRQVVLI
jgi:hypothetical protein